MRPTTSVGDRNGVYTPISKLRLLEVLCTRFMWEKCRDYCTRVSCRARRERLAIVMTGVRDFASDVE